MVKMILRLFFFNTNLSDPANEFLHLLFKTKYPRYLSIMDIPRDLAQLFAEFPSDKDRDAVLASMKNAHVKKLAIPYLPRDEWVAESPEIRTYGKPL